VDLTFGNWRGILAPADLSAADLLNQQKIMDILHSSPSWKDTLIAKSWIDEFRVGDAFQTWIKKENADIISVLTDFKLVK
jgi:putative tricarboxylic transport membrane protein